MGKKTTDNTLARVASKHEAEILEKFRQMIKHEEDLIVPTDDCYLLKFLRAAKLDPEKAFVKFTNWWRDRHRLPLLHDDLYPSNYKQIYESKFSTTFAHRDALGRQIVIWRAANWNPNEISFLEVFKSNFPVVDTITTRELTQLNGAVFIIDLAGLGMSHVKACGPSVIRTVLSLTDSFPLRIKGIHFVNHPAIFHILWTCAKAFMKPKMKKRVQFHGYDYKSLHKDIPTEILPISYEGILTEEEFEENGFIQTLLDREQYYIDLFTLYGYKSNLPHLKS